MQHQSLQTPIHIHIGMVWDAIFLHMVVHSQDWNQLGKEQEERQRWPENEEFKKVPVIVCAMSLLFVAFGSLNTILLLNFPIYVCKKYWKKYWPINSCVYLQMAIKLSKYNSFEAYC